MTEQRSYRLEGGPYHNTYQRVALINGEPPKWLHMIDPIGTEVMCFTKPWEDMITVHIYERQCRPLQPRGAGKWFYLKWNPTETPKPPE